MSDTITFKDIALLTGFTDKTVKRHEKDWGLKPHRAKGHTRPVKFWRGKAVEALRAAKILS